MHACYRPLMMTLSDIACENSGHSILDDFPEVRKIVEAGESITLD